MSTALFQCWSDSVNDGTEVRAKLLTMSDRWSSNEAAIL
jgi:hypothetical protein